jgi:branched-chain amino acid transport system ATP-binding protein
VIVQALADAITELRRRNYTIVLVEQNLRFAAPLADRHLLMEHGRIVADIPRDQVARQDSVFREYLGV